jgi:hypothetical protein
LDFVRRMGWARQTERLYGAGEPLMSAVNATTGFKIVKVWHLYA